MEISSSTKTARCPHCGGDVRFGPNVVEGEVIACAACGHWVEVVTLAPPALEPAAKVDDEWDEG